MDHQDQEKKANTFLRDKDFKETMLSEEVKVSARSEVDTKALTGNMQAIYMPVSVSNRTRAYNGTVILAKADQRKSTSNALFYDQIKFKELEMDYNLQTRDFDSYTSDSDEISSIFDLKYLVQTAFSSLKFTGLFEDLDEEVDTSDIKYRKNSIGYLEREIKDVSDGYYDKIIPYMENSGDAFIPTLQFARSQGGFPIPEFYLNYPIFVTEDGYDDLLDIKEEDETEFYHLIYKMIDGDSQTIQVIPEDIAGEMRYPVDKLGIVAMGFSGIPIPLGEFKNDGESFTYDIQTGALTFTGLRETIKNYGSLLIVIYLPKYVKISDDYEGISEEKKNTIAAMQSLHASVLEYCYQSQLAEEHETAIQNIEYTTKVTMISTIITSAVMFASGKGSFTQIITGGFKESFEEIWVDPFIEATIADVVEAFGGDEFMQEMMAIVVETVRESISGGISAGKQQTNNQKFNTNLQQRVDASYQKTGVNPSIKQKQAMAREIRQEMQQEKQSKKLHKLGKYRKQMLSVLGTLTFLAGSVVGISSGITFLGLAVGIKHMSSFGGDQRLNNREMKATLKQVAKAHDKGKLDPSVRAELKRLLFIDYVQNNKEALTTKPTDTNEKLITIENINPDVEGNEKITIKEDTFDNFNSFMDSYFKERTSTSNFRLKKSKVYRLKTGSLTGILGIGDVVAAQKVRAFSKYNKGDLLVYIDDDGNYVIHLVKAVKKDSDGTYYQMTGLNQEPDEQRVRKNDIVGKVRYSTKNMQELLDLEAQGKIEIQDALGNDAKYVILREPSDLLSEIKTRIDEIFSEKFKYKTDPEGNPLYVITEKTTGKTDIYKELQELIVQLPDKLHSSLLEQNLFLKIMKQEKIIEGQDKFYTSKQLDAFLYILESYGGERNYEFSEACSQTVREIKKFARKHKIHLQGFDPYHKSWHKDPVKGALVLDKINKYGGFDLALGKMLKDKIFQKGGLKYHIQHWRTKLNALVRKKSISVHDTLVTDAGTHKSEYDTALTEEDQKNLIQYWDRLMKKGMEQGELNYVSEEDNDILDVFRDLEVGKGKEKKPVYEKYLWVMKDMIKQLNIFIDAKTSVNSKVDVDEYIGDFLPTVLERWRENGHSQITIEQQIANVDAAHNNDLTRKYKYNYN